MKEIEVEGTVYEFPESMADEEILQVLQKQFAPPEPPATTTQEPQESLGSRVARTVAEPSTLSIPGALAGAAAGTPFGPPGQLAGAAIGAFGGGMTGEILRQSAAGEPAQPLRTLSEGAYESIIEMTGAKAVDTILTGGKAAKDLVSEGYGTLLNKMSRSTYTDPSELPVLQRLQKKLQEQYQTTLRPSQIAPRDPRLGALEAAAESSVGGSPALLNVADRQVQYLEDSIPELVRVISGESPMGREQLGQAIQSVVQNARSASSVEFGRRFEQLDELGKTVPVSLRPVQARARNAAQKQKVQTLSKAARERGDKLKFLSDSRLSALREDILKLPPNATFSSTYSILKQINRKIDEVYDAARPNDPIIVDLMNVRKQIQAQMKKAAEQSPELKEAYSGLMADYNKTQNTLYSDTAIALMKSGAPEEAGKILARPGMTTRPKMVKQLLEEARRLGVKEADKNILGSLRKGFIEKAVKNSDTSLDLKGLDPFARVKNLQQRFTDQEFVDTLKALYPDAAEYKQAEKTLQRLFDEADILSRSTGGELALSVRSRQLGAITGAIRPNRGILDRLGDIVTLALPDVLANVISNPKVANKLLSNIKIARSQAIKNGNAAPEVMRNIMGGLTSLGASAYFDAKDKENLQRLDAIKRSITQQ